MACLRFLINRGDIVRSWSKTRAFQALLDEEHVSADIGLEESDESSHGTRARVKQRRRDEIRKQRARNRRRVREEKDSAASRGEQFIPQNVGRPKKSKEMDPRDSNHLLQFEDGSEWFAIDPRLSLIFQIFKMAGYPTTGTSDGQANLCNLIKVKMSMTQFFVCKKHLRNPRTLETASGFDSTDFLPYIKLPQQPQFSPQESRQQARAEVKKERAERLRQRIFEKSNERAAIEAFV